MMIPGATLWLAHAAIGAHLALIFWAVYLDRLSRLA